MWIMSIGLFWKRHFSSKNCLGNILSIFCKNLGNFLFQHLVTLIIIAMTSCYYAEEEKKITPFFAIYAVFNFGVFFRFENNDLLNPVAKVFLWIGNYFYVSVEKKFSFQSSSMQLVDLIVDETLKWQKFYVQSTK